MWSIYKISTFKSSEWKILSFTSFFVLIFTIFVFTSTDSNAQISFSKGVDKPLGKYYPNTFESITLKGSRGETLVATAHVKVEGCDTLNLTSPKLPAVAYKLESYSVINPSYTNAPTGLIDDRLIPDRQACSSESQIARFLIEINIPYKLAPDIYKIDVNFQNEKSHFYVQVWPMTMPILPSLPVYIGLTPYGILLGHFKAWHKSESELFKSYQQLLLNNRLYPLSDGGVHYPPIQKMKDSEILNINGHPNKDLSFKSMILDKFPRGAYLSIPKLYPGTPLYKNRERYYSALANTPMLSKQKLLAYVWDEPTKDMYPALKRDLTILKKAAPQVKRMVTIPAFKEFLDLIDIFVPEINHFDSPGKPSPRFYHSLQTHEDISKRKEIWWYTGCMAHGCEALADAKTPDLTIDRPIASIRSIAWLSKKYNIQGFLYYNSVESYQYYPKNRDPYTDQWYFSGNGDGTLLYPARAGEHEFTKHHPLPSLRLKALQEMTYDSNYLSWLKVVKKFSPREYYELRGRFAKLVKRVNNFSLDYSEYQDLRDSIGDNLARIYNSNLRARLRKRSTTNLTR